MAQMLLIMGESGTGKSTSMRNCDPATTAVVNPVGKPLPFKGKFTMLNSEVESRKICKFMKEQAAAGKKLLVVDDFQYILSVPYMNRIKENGWDKWNDFGANYFEIIEVCKELPDDVVVAYMTHTETLENGVTTITVSYTHLHSGRWCSGNLKAAVQDSVTANLEETKRDKKILIVSGERRGESAGRSKYNEMEIHRTNAEAKAHRIVHQWRCCIDYSEKDVWELLKRHHINPHPCYRIGWNRCSCMMCIFSTPRLFAGVKELFPDDYAALRHDEEVLGFTLDNKKNLDEFIGDTQSCVCWKDKAAIHSILTGEFNTDDIYTNDWNYPVGAFHGADGGSC